MKRRRLWCIVVAMWIGFGVSVVAATELGGAETDSPPKSKSVDAVDAWSVDAGGGLSSGGGFTLIGAVGQPDAGQLSKGGTVIAGGLWAAAIDLQALFDDGFEDGDTGAWSSATGGTK